MSAAGSACNTVVVRTDGVIDAVGNGAPASWIGLELAYSDILGELERERFGDWLDQSRSGQYVWMEPFAAQQGGTVVVVLLRALPVRLSSFAPRELLQRAVDTFVEQARSESISLRVVVADDLPATVDIDPDKLLWVLATLIGNAIRMFKRSRREAEGAIEVHARFEASECELVMEVRDDGPGMTPETSLRLFHADPHTGRTSGLALVLARDVMTAHGGSIEVDTAIGKGTTFTLRIPATIMLS